MYIFIKSILDFVFGVVLFVLLLPVITISSLIVKLEDPVGPFFIKQPRVGKGGMIFKVYKLRTMIVKTHDSNNLELCDQDRLLKAGEVFRKLSIDELPQLLNIVKGEMSFIGPRPLPPVYLPYYSIEQNRRHELKPGISGWAQVNGRNSISWEDKFRLDVEYVDAISLFFDFKIASMTARTVFAKSDIVIRGEKTNIDFHIDKIRNDR